jgi:hypothetical protein
MTDITENDIRAIRRQGDLPRFLRQLTEQGHARNAEQLATVRRHPDLYEQMLALPGHAAWTGYVGPANKRACAILAKAQRRATAPAETAA